MSEPFFTGLVVNFVSSRIESLLAYTLKKYRGTPLPPPTIIEREIYKPTQVIVPGLTNVKCANCRSENKETNEYCTECGDPLYEECANCTQNKPRYETFCGKCGKNPAHLKPIKEYVAELLVKAKQLEKVHGVLLIIFAVALLLSIIITLYDAISWNSLIVTLWWLFIMASAIALGVEVYREYIWLVQTKLWADRHAWNKQVSGDIESSYKIFTNILTWGLFEFLALVAVVSGVAIFGRGKYLPVFASDPESSINARKAVPFVKLPMLKMWYKPGAFSVFLMGFAMVTGLFSISSVDIISNIPHEQSQDQVQQQDSQQTPPIRRATPIPTATTIPDECSDVVPATFVRNEEIMVCNTNLSEHPNLRLRLDHSTSASQIDSLPDGTKAIVEGGPICEEGLYWWRISVRTDNSMNIGWSAQGNEEVDWLCKVP